MSDLRRRDTMLWPVVCGSVLLLMALMVGPASAEPLVVRGLAQGRTGPACVGGAVKDDGALETGYGWVPSVVEGIYVQEFYSSEFDLHYLEKVCICWLRTRQDSAIDFEVVFYHDWWGTPAPTPFAVVPATATDVPDGVESGGRFYDVDVSTVEIPPGRFWIGARWNPSQESFFFICVDNGPDTEPVEVQYIDDRADGWASVFDTIDPMFDDHRAMMVRAGTARLAEVAVPGLGPVGWFIFAVALAVAAIWRLRAS